MIKTITYNPETHVLVPREPTPLQLQNGSEIDLAEETPDAYQEFLRDIYLSMIAAAAQPEQVESEPVGWYDGETGWLGKRKGGEHWQPVFTHQPADNKTVDVDPVAYIDCESPTGVSLAPSAKGLCDGDSLYTTPQPDRTAELEAALKVARDGIDKFLVANDPTEFGCACDLSVGYLCGPCHADMQQQPLKIALAKINEVLK